MKNFSTVINMESKYIGSENNPVSANVSTETMESRQSYKESPIYGRNTKSKLQVLKETVRDAERYYESTIQTQCNLLQSQYCPNYNKNDGTLSRKTSSSYNSFKMALSDDLNDKVCVENNVSRYQETDFNNDQENDFSINDHENDFNIDEHENDFKNYQDKDFDNDQENHEMIDDKEDINQVEVVLTPRSNKRNSESMEEIIPNMNVYMDESLDSIKTNTRLKKTSKLKKKSHILRVSSESGKIQTPSLIYSSKTKRKKFHGRLKNSNSKSTIATRDSNFSDKKIDKRKFKRQSLNTIRTIQSPPIRKRVNSVKARESKLLNKKEFVEIYHNTALKSGSLSMVSSKQSKIPPAHASYLSVEATDAVGDTKKRKKISKTEKTLHVEPQTYTKPADHEEQQTEGNVENNVQQYHVHEENGNTYMTDYYDPFYQRNYEMPTEASKMKRVHRSYFPSFHIHSIPFVVGTSISPSHNIGLNIQQMLSIIKTKQPTMTGISPLLIRKVSKGIQPVTTIFEQINPTESRSYNNFSENNRHQDIACYSYEQLQNNKLNSSMSNHQNSHKQNFTCEPLYEEDEDCQSLYSESQYRNPIPQGNTTNCYEAHSRLNGGASTQLNACRQQSNHKQKRCQQLAEVPVDDSFTGSYFTSANSNKEITEVLVRLHDQYDKMIKQYDKLKERPEKGKDKTVAKEIAELEEALCAKDQEIKAVVNLFNEVRSLKEQMKRLEQRNSFVCIAREDPAFSAKTKIRARTAGPFIGSSRPRHQFGRRIHATPHALQLTAVLRQIQAFQRQHSLA